MLKASGTSLPPQSFFPFIYQGFFLSFHFVFPRLKPWIDLHCIEKLQRKLRTSTWIMIEEARHEVNCHMDLATSVNLGLSVPSRADINLKLIGIHMERIVRPSTFSCDHHMSCEVHLASCSFIL